MTDYPYRNFYEMIEARALGFPNKTVMFDGDKKMSYAELRERVDTFARFLEFAGIERGDRVALFMGNCNEFVVALFGITKIGAVAVPINNFLKAAEATYILNDCGAKLLIASASLNAIVADFRSDVAFTTVVWEGEGVEYDNHNIGFDEIFEMAHPHGHVNFPDIDDLALIIYTSGTTGNPKGAMLSFKNVFSNCEAVKLWVNITGKDRFIVYLPMFHSFTLTVTVLLPIYIGASFVVIRSIKPFSNIFKQVLVKRVTIFTGVPDVYNALSRAKLPWYFMWFNKIRAFVSGAAPLNATTIETMNSKFGRAKLLEGYGLSECSPVVSVNPLQRQKQGSVGPAMPGYEVKIVDEEMNALEQGLVGEIIVKGDNVMRGYLNNVHETAETIVNGWLMTGDLGYLDEEGYIFIVDRKKDLIISKGINVYPREIEEAIARFDGVFAAAVIGRRGDDGSETPIAFVETQEGAVVEASDIKRFLKNKLANYKLPKEILVVEELPKNATGKVLKRVLKERLRQSEAPA